MGKMYSPTKKLSFPLCYKKSLTVKQLVKLFKEKQDYYFPKDNDTFVSSFEMIVLIICNLVSTVGLTGDISRHLLDPGSIDEGFLAGWHLVLYGGVIAVGLWLGLGAIRKGPQFIGAVLPTTLGFFILSAGGLADWAWHTRFGVEVSVEALVSPPHLFVLVGLVCLLMSPVYILWKQDQRKLGLVPSLIAVCSVTITLLVVMLFTGFLSPLVGGMELQPGYIEPLVGESPMIYDQVRGLGITIWTTVLVVAGFMLIFTKFKLFPGVTLVGFASLAVPSFFVVSEETWPVAAAFAVTGLLTEVSLLLFARPTLGKFGAGFTGALIGFGLWFSVFKFLENDSRLLWETTLWTGTASLSGLVGFVIGSLLVLHTGTVDALKEAKLRAEVKEAEARAKLISELPPAGSSRWDNPTF
jgi:hypothetical protein